jgi:hypothetical protein
MIAFSSGINISNIQGPNIAPGPVTLPIGSIIGFGNNTPVTLPVSPNLAGTFDIDTNQCAFMAPRDLSINCFSYFVQATNNGDSKAGIRFQLFSSPPPASNTFKTPFIFSISTSDFAAGNTETRTDTLNFGPFNIAAGTRLILVVSINTPGNNPKIIFNNIAVSAGLGFA